jgi:hypothetical protein
MAITKKEFVLEGVKVAMFALAIWLLGYCTGRDAGRAEGQKQAFDAVVNYLAEDGK